jgi:hypothetical protein
MTSSKPSIRGTRPLAATLTFTFAIGLALFTFTLGTVAAGAPSAQAEIGLASAAPGLATAAPAPTITPSLSPDRTGAKASLTLAIRFAAGKATAPPPVRRSILRLPAGMSLHIPKLRSCSTAHLRAHGAKGCPPPSEIGTGHALMTVHAGSQNITEDVALRAFLGPLGSDSQPTFEVLAQGHTPLERRVVLTGAVLSTHAPFGEELVLSIPPIPTLPFEPDASILTFSLTIGAGGRHGAHAANTVIVPADCPVGGFPFAAEFTYADGSADSGLSTVPCP